MYVWTVRLLTLMPNLSSSPKDALRSPQLILACHGPDHLPGVCRNAWMGGWSCRPGLPDESKALSMPVQERLGLNEYECMLPGRDTGSEEHHEESIERGEVWACAVS